MNDYIFNSCNIRLEWMCDAYIAQSSKTFYWIKLNLTLCILMHGLDAFLVDITWLYRLLRSWNGFQVCIGISKSFIAGTKPWRAIKHYIDGRNVNKMNTYLQIYKPSPCSQYTGVKVKQCFELRIPNKLDNCGKLIMYRMLCKLTCVNKSLLPSPNNGWIRLIVSNRLIVFLIEYRRHMVFIFWTYIMVWCKLVSLFLFDQLNGYRNFR